MKSFGQRERSNSQCGDSMAEIEYPFDSFVFYRSFRDAIEEMTDENKLATLLAICDYALYGVEPNLKDPMSRAVFTVARPSIDSNSAKRIGGKKGGRPKKGTIGYSEENHRFSKNESTVSESETGTEESTLADKPPTRRRFVPPTVEQVAEYVRSRGSNVDPKGFIDFYEAKGWMVGKTPMKDWKAACRNAESWERWKKPDSDGKGDPYGQYF